MVKIPTTVVVYAGAAGVAALAVYMLYSKVKNTQFNPDQDGRGGFFQDAAAGSVKAVGGAVDGIVSGAVLGLGDVLGVPRTDKTKCAQARAAGRTWDALTDCPVMDFASYMWN